jgi:nucleoid DNA-binding protein
MSVKEIDYMEGCDNDANAQAAYVTDATEVVDQQQTNGALGGFTNGDVGGSEYRTAQSFKLSGLLTITAVEVMCYSASGSPSGNWTLRIETDSGGVPSGTLANANASIVVTPPTAGNVVKGTFAQDFSLTGATSYWIVIQNDNQSNDKWWQIARQDPSGTYADGNMASSTNGSWVAYTTHDAYFKVYTKSLQSYSESTIKTQGSYALKAVAAITDALNKTLTKTFSPALDLSGKASFSFDMRATRTGSNIKVGLHDSGGVTTEITPNIVSAGEFQKVTCDISAVADADKNAIDSMIITIVNADA